MGRTAVLPTACQEIPVELTGLRLRVRGELLLQHRAEPFEHHQCLGAAAGGCEGTHHRPVHRFVQPVRIDDGREHAHRCRRVAFGQVVVDQLHDQPGAPLSDVVGMLLRPRLVGILRK